MPAALPALGGILAGFGAVSLGFTTTIAGTALVGAIAGGVIAVVNVVLTLTTSDKVGIPDKSVETKDKPKEETKDETNEHKETFKMPYDTSAG